MFIPKDDLKDILPKKIHCGKIGSQEDGSIIVIALIVLAVLTVGGIAATQRSITESFIVRNTGMHKQNLHLADTAAMLGLREIIGKDEDDLADDPFPDSWMHNTNDWNDNPYDPHSGDDDSYPLVDANSAVPEAASDGDIDILDERGETDDGTLRYYLVGWQGVAGQSIALGQQAMWRSGKIVGVYDSERFGRKTVDIGLIKRF